MSSPEPFQLKWGILSTGRIAVAFAKDLVIDPSTRDVKDVVHKVVAVGSSSGKEKAVEFISKIGKDPNDIAAYGNYDDLVQDKNVDIIYIGTPHSHHYANALSALRAGKHVCCEKAFTINAKQTEHLISLAKSKNLFLMEAVWTRFFPLSLSVLDHIHTKRTLGRIIRVYADFSKTFKPDAAHRLFNPDLGGGALLDLGIYSLIWSFLTLYRDPENKGKEPKVSSTVIKSELTGVDAITTVALAFETLGASAVATTSLAAETPTPYGVLIQGEKGELTIPSPIPRPLSYTIKLDNSTPQTSDFPIPAGGMGLFWEADACARAIRDGKLEAEGSTLAESLAIMKVMDQVRETAGFKYPASIEAVE